MRKASGRWSKGGPTVQGGNAQGCCARSCADRRVPAARSTPAQQGRDREKLVLRVIRPSNLLGDRARGERTERECCVSKRYRALEARSPQLRATGVGCNQGRALWRCTRLGANGGQALRSYARHARPRAGAE